MSDSALDGEKRYTLGYGLFVAFSFSQLYCKRLISGDALNALRHWEIHNSDHEYVFYFKL